MKKLAIPVTIVLTLIGGAIGYGELKGKVSSNSGDIVEVKEDVKVAEDELVNRKLTDTEQSIHIKQMQENQKQIQQNQLHFLKEFAELQAAK